jgi:hypothetical protein
MDMTCESDAGLESQVAGMEKLGLRDQVKMTFGDYFQYELQMRQLAADDELMKQVGSHIRAMYLSADDEETRTYCEYLIKSYNRLLAWREFNKRLEPKITSWINKLNNSLVRYTEKLI